MNKKWYLTIFIPELNILKTTSGDFKFKEDRFKIKECGVPTEFHSVEPYCMSVSGLVTAIKDKNCGKYIHTNTIDIDSVFHMMESYFDITLYGGFNYASIVAYNGDELKQYDGENIAIENSKKYFSEMLNMCNNFKKEE